MTNLMELACEGIKTAIITMLCMFKNIEESTDVIRIEMEDIFF